MKFNRKTQEKERILKLIQNFYEQDNLELEAIIYGFGSQYNINYHNFTDAINRLMADSNLAKHKPKDILNIYFKPDSKYKNIRVSVMGEGSIKNYCATDSLKQIQRNVKFLLKENYIANGKLSRVDMYDYHVRYNLKTEKELSEDDPIVKELKSDWNTLDKIFRQKQIHSFSTQSHRFTYDLSIVKNSTNTVQKMSLGDVLEQKKQHLVRKPRHIKESFYDWWQSIRHDLSYQVDVSSQPFYYKRIQNSNVFINSEEYEIEVELNKLEEDEKKPPKDIFVRFIERIGAILQAVQGSYYLIAESDKQQVIQNYQNLINNKSSNLFHGPIPLALNMDQIEYYSQEEYNQHSLDNIRYNYVVTDKADGERCFLYIDKNSKAYLISRNSKTIQNIRYTGCSIAGYGNTLLDGEYITMDMENNEVANFLYFDIYYLKGDDVRKLPLGFNERQKGTRQNLMLQLDEDIKKGETLVPINKMNQFTLFRKKYYKGDVIGRMKQENAIFQANHKIMMKVDKIYGGLLSNGHFFSYKVIGLMMLPANLGMGQNYVGDTLGILGEKVWYRNYSWTPNKYNSIDFHVKLNRNLINKEIMEEYNNGQRYKQVFLQVLYHPKYHNKYNSQKIINEGLTYPDTHQYINFEPCNPFHGYTDANGQLINDIQIASIPTNSDGDLLDFDGEIIHEGNTVEFIYDEREPEERFRWKPLKLKENTKASSFHSAYARWKTIKDPISLQMITTGIIPDRKRSFISTKMPNEYATKPFKAFINYLKTKLMSVVNEDNKDLTLLCLSSQKLNDLKRWHFNHVTKVVIIEDNLNVIHDPNDGTASRLLEQGKDPALKKLARNSFIICADLSKNISNGEAGVDLLNKYYLNILYGNQELTGINVKLEKMWGTGKEKFNVITCHDGMAKYFKDLDMVESFVFNIAENLKSNGKFIGCCLDGETIFNELKTVEKIEGKEGDKHIWSITKDYQTSPNYPKNHLSTGYAISKTIQHMCYEEDEYLVHFDFLHDMMAKYGLKLLDSKMFHEQPTSLYHNFKSDHPAIYQKLEQYKSVASLLKYHRWFIFIRTSSKLQKRDSQSSGLHSSLFQISESSARSKNISEPDPDVESFSQEILPENMNYDEEDNMVSEYNEAMSYDYDDTIPKKSGTKANSKKATPDSASISDSMSGAKSKKKIRNKTKHKKKHMSAETKEAVQKVKKLPVRTNKMLTRYDKMIQEKPNITMTIVKEKKK